MSTIRFVGLDVHKDTIVMSVADSGNAEAAVIGTFPDDVNRIMKQLRKLSAELSLLRVCYEAGPTGFGLCRRLKEAGIDCKVIAPSLVPQQSGLRIKTDRRDSRKLAHFLRSGDLTEVWIPGEKKVWKGDRHKASGPGPNRRSGRRADQFCACPFLAARANWRALHQPVRRSSGQKVLAGEAVSGRCVTVGMSCRREFGGGWRSGVGVAKSGGTVERDRGKGTGTK